MTILKFLSLLDSEGNLSITNIAVIVAITKMAFVSQFTGVDSVALIGTMLNYAHKRMVNNS
jgi:hypothetical protein